MLPEFLKTFYSDLVRIYENQLGTDSPPFEYLRFAIPSIQKYVPRAILSRRLTISPHRRFTPPYNDRPVEQWLLTARSWNARGSCRAARLRKCPVFYIFALERAVESRNRVLENQLLVTVRGKDAPTSGPTLFFLSSLRSRRSFVRSQR